VVAEHPLREGLRRQLITALHRTGRHAEALGVYAETRALLAEELDPARRPGQRPPDADPGPPGLLPADVPDFTGRGADLDRLLRPAGAPDRVPG
jgi:hypothetical protein